MIDYNNVSVSNPNVDAILKNPNLEFVSGCNRKTFEVENRGIAKYKGLTFEFFNQYSLKISGSLHKYFNNGLHNYNDFNQSDLNYVLDDMSETFDLNMDDCILRGLEIGVNFRSPIKCSKVIRSALMVSTKRLERGSVYRGNFKESTCQRYYAKFYDKTSQYKLNKELLRFELKFRRMEDIKGAVKTLEDLRSESNMKFLSSILLRAWKEVLFIDPTIREGELTRNQQDKKIYQWRDVEYWLGLKFPSSRFAQRKELQKVIINHSDDIYGALSFELNNKIDSMLDPPPFKMDDDLFSLRFNNA